MSGQYILRDGEPVPVDDVIEWGRWFEGADEERRIGATDVGDVHVSTVFLGLDHSFGHGPPLLFETMVFGGEHDEWQDRYSTRTQAEAGHEAVVSALRNGGPLPE